MSIESAVDQAAQAFAKSFETQAARMDLDDGEILLRVEAHGQRWCYKMVCDPTCHIVRYPC